MSIYNQTTSSKFHLYCSCVVCKKQVTVQNLVSHTSAYHTPKQPDSYCLQCNLPIFSKVKKFCNHHCSATYSNLKRDYSTFTPGPAKGSIIAPAYTKVQQCIICNKWHTKKSKTCSAKCKSKLLSIRVNERIDNGWNPQEHRCRSIPSYLEKSFEHWLIAHSFTNYIKNKTFRCNKKIYYGDFYFPEQNILIELDGKQHEQTTEYDQRRDQLILQHHNILTLRINHNEYLKQTKSELVKSLLGIKEQVTGFEPV